MPTAAASMSRPLEKRSGQNGAGEIPKGNEEQVWSAERAASKHNRDSSATAEEDKHEKIKIMPDVRSNDDSSELTIQYCIPPRHRLVPKLQHKLPTAKEAKAHVIDQHEPNREQAESEEVREPPLAVADGVVLDSCAAVAAAHALVRQQRRSWRQP